jgi:hypothetical protein
MEQNGSYSGRISNSWSYVLFLRKRLREGNFKGVLLMFDKLKEFYKTRKVELWGVLAVFLAVIGYFVYENSTGKTGATGAAGINATPTATTQGNDTNTATTSTSGGQVGQSAMKPATPAIPTTNHPVINEANANIAATTGTNAGSGPISSDASGMSVLPKGS